MTAAIAVLDVNGNVLNLYSQRDMKRSEMIRHILKFGSPIIVSTDVITAPKSVEKIAARFGCILFSPESQLSFEKKKSLVKDYHGLTNNHHEMDALSASVKAWKHYRHLFEKIDLTLRKFERGELFMDIISKLIKEKRANIEEAVREVVNEG
ncbi:MAG: DUF460 domain-containing protein [Candidatus Aenigmarchaeota archaeon]|nr:DUF460 domain-containing protein [Candidatus Aenigmarchaeota archaeon]